MTTLLSSLTMLTSLQVKVAILKYIETLAKQMDPGDFINSSETRLAVSRVITWTTEPKSSDVRKVCVLYGLEDRLEKLASSFGLPVKET